MRRCAQRLRSAYADLQTWHDPTGQLLHAHWETAQRLRRQLRLALEHGWYAAARLVADRLTRTLSLLESHLADLRRPLVDRLYRADSLPTLRELQHELRSLADEFVDVRLKSTDSRLIVITEPIDLNGIYLGAFEIALDLEHPVWTSRLLCEPSIRSLPPATTMSRIRMSAAFDCVLVMATPPSAVRCATLASFDFFQIVVDSIDL